MIRPPTRLLLIRHGATPWNDAQRIIGRTDLPLSERGKVQAGLLAERLGAELAGGAPIDAQHAGQTVALAGHGGVFQALLFAALGLPYRNDWVFYLYNGSLSELWLRSPRNVAVYLNDTAHLGAQQNPT